MLQSLARPFFLEAFNVCELVFIILCTSYVIINDIIVKRQLVMFCCNFFPYIVYVSQKAVQNFTCNYLQFGCLICLCYWSNFVQRWLCRLSDNLLRESIVLNFVLRLAGWSKLNTKISFGRTETNFYIQFTRTMYTKKAAK